MCPRREVIPRVGTEKPFEMTLIEDDDMIETFAADGADQTLDIGRLPGGAWSNGHFPNAWGRAMRWGMLILVVVCAMPGLAANNEGKE